MILQVNGSFSQWIDVLNDVTQDSLLGPLGMFLRLCMSDAVCRWQINLAHIQHLDDKESLHCNLVVTEWSRQWLLEVLAFIAEYGQPSVILLLFIRQRGQI